MGYVVKHSTTSVNNARKKGNVALGVDADGYDKTSVSGFYAGVAPVPGFHNLVRTSATTDPDFYTLTDLELVNFANSLGGSVSDVTGAKVYLASRNDVMFTDEIPEDTVTEDLIVELDASQLSSYPGSGSIWYDLSGNGNDFTLYNGPSFTSDYLNFDGTNQYARSTNTLDLSPYDAVTVEVTFRANTTSSPTGMLFEHSSNWNNQAMGFGLVPNSAGSTTYLNNSHHTNQTQGAGSRNYTGIIGLDINTHTNVWSRVASSEGRLAYINAEPKNPSNTSTSNYSSFRNDYFYLASRNGTSVWYNVRIYSIKIYGTKLTTPKIAQNYYKSNIITDDLIFAIDAGNLVSYESGSLKSYSLLSSTSGSLENGVNYHPEFGGYFSFDGSNDRILMEQNSSPSSTYGIPLYYGDQPWMVNAWVRTTTGGSNSIAIAPILSNRSGGPVYCNMGIGNGGVMKYNHYDGAWQTSVGNIPVNDGRWHMLSWVNRDNDTMDLYVDGVFDTNVPSEIVGGPSNPVDIIGGSWASYFDGDIAFLSIYRGSTLFTSDDVLQNYNAQKSRFIEPDPTLETDGEWLKVFRHYSGDNDFFSSANDWAEAKSTNTDNPQANKYSILDTLYRYELDGKFTFKLVYPSQSLENPAYSNVTNIWSQTNNPVRDNGLGGVTGYTAISIDSTSSGWGGLERRDSQSSTFLDGTLIPAGNWWWAIGSKNNYDGSNPNFPGPGQTTRLVELWVKYK